MITTVERRARKDRKDTAALQPLARKLKTLRHWPGIEPRGRAEAYASLLLRFFEAGGAVRQAISVLKKRSGPHEKTIRELRLEPSGITVGEPLTEFHAVLTGVPVYNGAPSALPPVGA